MVSQKKTLMQCIGFTEQNINAMYWFHRTKQCNVMVSHNKTLMQCIGFPEQNINAMYWFHRTKY